MTQQATRPEIFFSIPPRAFGLNPKSTPPWCDWLSGAENEAPVAEPIVFQAMVKSLLAHRRKNISNNIKRLRSAILDESTVRLGPRPTRHRSEPSRRNTYRRGICRAFSLLHFSTIRCFDSIEVVSQHMVS